MIKSTCTICLYLLVLGLASCLSASAQDDTEPVQLDEIVVTPGRFAIDDGTPSKLSLSKQRIEQFPLVDDDVMRAAHIFPRGRCERLQRTIQRTRRREGRYFGEIRRDGALQPVPPTRLWRCCFTRWARFNPARRIVDGWLPSGIRR